MFIKRIINYFKNKYKLKQQLRSLNYGDIIWLEIKKMNGVVFRKGHQKRPFFVLRIEKDKIVCLPFTHRRQSSFTVFDVNDVYGSLILSHGFFKVPFKHFVSFSDKGRLTSYDLSKITKRMMIYFNKDPYIQSLGRYIRYLPNDIVVCHDDDQSVDRYYVVYDVETVDNVRRLKLYEYSKYFKKDYVEVGAKFFIKDDVVMTTEDDDLRYFNTFKDDKRNVIKEYLDRKKYKLKKEKKKQNKKTAFFSISEAKIGDGIIYKGERYYYIGQDARGYCLVANDYSKTERIKEDIQIKRSGETASNDQLTFLRNMFFF